MTFGTDLDCSATVNENHKSASTVFADFPLSTLFSPYFAASQFFDLGGQFYVIPSAGVRGFFHSVWADSVSPQAGLVAGWNGLEASFSYARGVIYPAPAILQGLAESDGLGGMDLNEARPETVHHFEWGLSFRQAVGQDDGWPGWLSLSASYYYDDGRDRIVAAGRTVPGNASVAAYFRIQGLEAGGSFSFGTGTPLFENIEVFTGCNWIIGLQAKGEDGKEVDRMPYTPVFTVSAGLKWTFFKHFHLSGDYQLLHDLYSGGLSNSSPSFFELSDSQRLDDISLLGLRFSYSFEYAKLRVDSGELFIAASNLLDLQYEYYQGYKMPPFSLSIGASAKLK